MYYIDKHILQDHPPIVWYGTPYILQLTYLKNKKSVTRRMFLIQKFYVHINICCNIKNWWYVNKYVVIFNICVFLFEETINKVLNWIGKYVGRYSRDTNQTYPLPRIQTEAF